jgi:tyrosyl-tRNA synthetase
VTKKLRKAYAAPKEVEGNGVLAFVEYVLLPASELGGKRGFTVDRSRDGLEPLEYTKIEQMHDDYRNEVVCIDRLLGHSWEKYSRLTQRVQLTPQILKPAVAVALNKLLEPVQKAYQASKEWQEVAVRAYPPPVVEKKVKKVKDKGTRRPAKDGQAADAASAGNGQAKGAADGQAADGATALPVRPAAEG